MQKKELIHKNRFFIGIPLSESGKMHLKKYLDEIPGQKVRPENLHLTLHFLGNVSDERLVLIKTKLQEVSLPLPFEVKLDSLKAVPDALQTQFIWVSVKEKHQGLHNLHSMLEESLGESGIDVKEKRPFVPHFTLSHFSIPLDVSQWIKNTEFVPFIYQVERIVLYQSLQEEGYSRYVEIEQYQHKK